MRLDAVGDVLMTTPALRALTESARGRHLTLLTSRAGAAAAALVPEVDDVLVHDVPWMKATASDAPPALDRALVRRLRRGGFDAAVIFTVYSQSPLPAALLCRLADVPLRLAHCRENPYQLLTDWVPEPEPERLVRHEVRRQLDLVASVGCTTHDERLSLRVPPRAAAAARRKLRALGLEPHGRWLAIHPGATAPSRRYPVEGFAAAARELAAGGWALVFVGARGERALVDEIRRLAGVRAHSLAGETDLAELAALLALSPLLIANNSGPVHVAAAVGTPVVDLYALTNPQHTPWRTPSRVLSADVPCKYCYKSVCPEGHNACLRSVTPEAIVVAVGDLLDATTTSGATALH
ncbi:MAG: lipopolysaccharide heptosyltransferase II [Thermodesulfobacteriota bacterium]